MTGQGIERQRRGTNGVRHSRDSSCRSYVETVASGTDSLLECRIASYIVFVLLMRLDLVAFVRRTPPRINTSVTLSSGRVHLNRPTNRPTDRPTDRSIDRSGYHRRKLIRGIRTVSVPLRSDHRLRAIARLPRESSRQPFETRSSLDKRISIKTRNHAQRPTWESDKLTG